MIVTINNPVQKLHNIPLAWSQYVYHRSPFYGKCGNGPLLNGFFVGTSVH